MSGSEETNFLADPSFYISLAALTLAGWNFLYTRRTNTIAKKRAEFIEYIAVEFAKVETALDNLETKVRRAKNKPEIDSDDIMDLAVPAIRISNRTLIALSKMKDISIDLTEQIKVDQLDEILLMADTQAFDGDQRNLSIRGALIVLQRISANCASAKSELQSTHLL